MEGLRWLLLLFGLLVIAGVYVYSRRKNAPTDKDAPISDRLAPSLDGDTLPDRSTVVDDEPGVDDEIDESDRFVPSAPQKIVTVRIVARDKKSFAGDELVLNMSTTDNAATSEIDVSVCVEYGDVEETIAIGDLFNNIGFTLDSPPTDASGDSYVVNN